MYGSIFRMKVKSGQESKVADIFKEFERDRQTNIKGIVGGFIMKPDNFTGELIGVAVFQDRATYRANADDPGQHQWYLKLRELMEEDPAWEDGEYIVGSVN